MLEPQQPMCRLHLSEDPTAKGLRLNISLDAVFPELTPDDQILEELRILRNTRWEWEQQCKTDGRTVAPAE